MSELPVIAAGAITAGLIGTNIANQVWGDWQAGNLQDKLSPVPGQISINVPGYNERPDTIRACFDSLRAQNIVRAMPDKFEFLWLASNGDPGLDQALPTVREYTNKIVISPVRGKLRARDMGIAASKGSMIVSVDSDSYYPPNWLNMMLKPYEDPAVIATTGSTDMGWPANAFTSIFRNAFFDMNLLTGRCSTFLKSAYYAVGGFDLAVEQNYSGDPVAMEIWQEEEIGFREKLDRIGKVVFVNAPVQHIYEYNKPKNRGLHVAPAINSSQFFN